MGGRRWTPADVVYLRLAWWQHAPAVIRQRLGRSWDAIRMQRIAMGLPAVPAEFESTKAAGRRTGFHPSVLERWLDADGVERRACYPCSDHSVNVHAYYVAKPDVDAVIERRKRHESLGAACARHHVDRATMRRVLSVKGLVTSDATREHVKIERYAVDHAVSEWRETPEGRMSVSVAATLRSTGERRQAIGNPNVGDRIDAPHHGKGVRDLVSTHSNRTAQTGAVPRQPAVPVPAYAI